MELVEAYQIILFYQMMVKEQLICATAIVFNISPV